MPRFVPYHLDLIRELTLKQGDRVLVTSAGPGAEVLAVARAIGDRGAIRATDRSPAMVGYCAEQVKKAGFSTAIACVEADAANTAGGPWDAIVCCFGLWQYEDRHAVLTAWRASLAPEGKVGILTWGPADPDDPYEQLNRALKAVAPQVHSPDTRIQAERGEMAAMFDAADLDMLRHTVVRHTINFRSTEEWVSAISESCTFRRIWEELDEETYHRIVVRFYDTMGGPDAPLSYRAPATIAIACPKGANVELEGRPSFRPPSMPSPKKK